MKYFVAWTLLWLPLNDVVRAYEYSVGIRYSAAASGGGAAINIVIWVFVSMMLWNARNERRP